MKPVIFYTENAVFTFNKKAVKEQLICKKTEHVPYEITQLSELISTDTDLTILIPDDHDYFRYVALDLISKGMGTVTCYICGKKFDAGQPTNKISYIYSSCPSQDKPKCLNKGYTGMQHTRKQSSEA